MDGRSASRSPGGKLASPPASRSSPLEAVPLHALGRALACLVVGAGVVFFGLIANNIYGGPSLAALFTDWTTFTRWNGRSINFGTDVTLIPPATWPLTPATVSLAWSGIAALAYRLWSVRATERRHVLPWLLIVSLPWLLLDLRWQAELAFKHALSTERYAGKSLHEKLLADTYGDVVAMLDPFHRALGREPRRILMVLPASMTLVDHSRHTRAAWYLLPHNILSTNAQQLQDSPAMLRGAEYLAVLGPVPGIRFDASSGLLTLPGGGVAATLAATASGSALYHYHLD